MRVQGARALHESGSRPRGGLRVERGGADSDPVEGEMHSQKSRAPHAKVRAGGLDWVDGSVDERSGAAPPPPSPNLGPAGTADPECRLEPCIDLQTICELRNSLPRPGSGVGMRIPEQTHRTLPSPGRATRRRNTAVPREWWHRFRSGISRFYGYQSSSFADSRECWWRATRASGCSAKTVSQVPVSYRCLC